MDRLPAQQRLASKQCHQHPHVKQMCSCQQSNAWDAKCTKAGTTMSLSRPPTILSVIAGHLKQLAAQRASQELQQPARLLRAGSDRKNAARQAGAQYYSPAAVHPAAPGLPEAGSHICCA